VDQRTRVVVVPESDESFESFFERAEPRLRPALVALYGIEFGREAAADALSYAWEHWDQVCSMKNPLGYLYRVGQSSTRRRKTPIVFARPLVEQEPWVEPQLGAALAQLTEKQRLAVVLIHGYGWRPGEVAEVTGLKVPTIQTHATRGLVRLRNALEVNDHA
jgi:DNA-directed RNA polymerase specialized sigma24 family protein